MSTETISTVQEIVESAQVISARELLLQYLKQNGYKLRKEETPMVPDKKEDLLVVAKQGKKELIDLRAISAFYPLKEQQEEHDTKMAHVFHAIQAVAESLLYSFVHFGRYFKGDKLTSALALPDTERYHQILEKLEDYFTENNLDVKVYLVAESGEVQEKNLNQKKNKETAVSKEEMKRRKELLSE